MTKQEAIAEIRKAADRVAKGMDYVGASAKALDTAITMLTSVRDEITKAGDLPSDMYMDLGGVFRILDSVCCGYPMIPAVAEVEKAAAKKLAQGDFLEHAATELEKAAAEKDAGAVRLAALKMSLAAWEAEKDEAAQVPVIEPAQVIDLVKRAAVQKAADDAAKAAAAPSVTDRLAAVAKQADAPVVTPPAAAAAPAKPVWGTDFNALKAAPGASASAKAQAAVRA